MSPGKCAMKNRVFSFCIIRKENEVVPMGPTWLMHEDVYTQAPLPHTHILEYTHVGVFNIQTIDPIIVSFVQIHLTLTLTIPLNKRVLLRTW